MADIRKIIIIFVIAILFSILVFAVIGAVYPEPKYEDFCKQKFAPPITKPITATPDGKSNCKDIGPSVQEQKSCVDKHGFIDYTYQSDGCAVSYECNTCQYEFQTATDNYKLYVFYISAFLALIAIFVGMYLPAKSNTLNEWIGTGFMLGGAFALFFGTAFSYNSLHRYVKPIVIFLELGLIIFIAYRKVSNFRRDNKKLAKKK